MVVLTGRRANLHGGGGVRPVVPTILGDNLRPCPCTLGADSGAGMSLLSVSDVTWRT